MNFTINNNSYYKTILDAEKNNKRSNMHSFHRYYGKLIPAIPATFIKEFSKENDLIFDPFVGSGTTAVEALLNNRNFVGVEINPLSANIARIKTQKLSTPMLKNLNEEILHLIRSKNYDTISFEPPYLLNRDHWFKDYVQNDLLIINAAINDYFENIIDDFPEKNSYKLFYQMTLSAILKNVSNCDTRHVFPGVSKRIRKLEEEGKNDKNVIASFERGIKKRAEYYSDYDTNCTASIILSDSTNLNLEGLKNKVDLIITNPPYISSVRYIETLKIEMYWMEYIHSLDEYNTLANKMLGNDKIKKSEYQELEYTDYDQINTLINEMSLLDMKSAKIIGTFFNQMEKVISNMAYVLKPGGKAVIKISDSKMKKKTIKTGEFISLIASKHGFDLVDVFLDEINNNSRSLTTARNTYSDIITHDYILIWEKKE